jgi:amino acid adenylation domain-containing protein
LIEGPLNFQILTDVLREVFARYEILRTTFCCPEGSTIPLQRVNEKQAPAIAEYKLIDHEVSRQEAEVEALFQEIGQVPFDLTNGPVLRVSFLILSADRNMLLLSMPSICADTVSLQVLVREISRSYYSAYEHCHEPSIDCAQYADLAEWENDLIESEQARGGRRHWLEAEALVCSAPKLPFERRHPSSAGFSPRHIASPITPQLAAKIGEVAARYEASASAFFLACWQILVWRLTGESDFVVGLACDGRTYEELHEAVGLFAKTLPVHSQLEEQLPFGELLKRTDGSTRLAFEWQEYFSFEQLPHLNLPGEQCHFLPIAFEFREAGANYTQGDTKFFIHKEYSCSDRFTLRLSCLDRGELAVTELHYDPRRFFTEDIDRMLQEFQTLLESACANPESRIIDLDITSANEKRRLLTEFNHTRREYPKGKCIYEAIAERARHSPDHVAISFGDRCITYGQLEAHANQLAHYLRGLGVGAEVPVALCIDRSPEMIVGILGVLKAGGAYVPLEPAYPRDRLAYMIENAHATVLLTQQSLRNEMLAWGTEQVVCLDSDWETIARHSEDAPPIKSHERNLAYLIYTSGSTGQPKGVMVEHGGLLNAINWIVETLGLTPSDSCIFKTSITFDAAGRELFPMLLAGGTIIIAEAGGHRDSRYLVDTIRSKRVSILHCVPSLLRLLLDEPGFDQSLALRAVMSGGEALPPTTVTRFQSRSGAKLYNVYGPTEAIIDSTYWLCEDGDASSTIPIGRPIPNARIYILDDRLNPLPIGVGGQLYISGAGLARGYVADPGLTAERFIPDPFSGEAGARLYNTGDLARYLSDGNIEFIGRSDYQVKIRGFRIELGEIESTLESHPAVREAIVRIHEHRIGEKHLVAYVVTNEIARPIADQLRGFLKDKLPEYMQPAGFVTLEAFPLSANGKVDRSALPAPIEWRPELDEAFVASRSPTEELLAEIWSEVLGIERVGIYHNFFELGGHSLLATQVISRIREVFQVELPLRRLFEAPTIAGLAEDIDAGRAGLRSAPAIMPIARDRELPLSFAQQRLWFLDQLEPGSSVYNFPIAVRLKGTLNTSALKQSLDEIVARHEALRTTFDVVDGRPVEIIAPALSVALPIVDLSGLPVAEREIEVERLATEEARRPFDLAKGPLVRAILLRLNENEHVGLLTMHHIVTDGWSTGILIREMGVLYGAFCAGMVASLPELPVQYADFADWQRHWLAGEVLESQLAYWKGQLKGVPPLLELPADHSRPIVQSFRGAHQSLDLPENLSVELKALSRQQSVTLFMTLLSAFKILLHYYTSRDDILIGTPIAGRNRLEIEGLVGFFVNTLVLRTDLSGDPDFPEVLRRVREVCLGAYAHQDLPFERLVEELHLARNLSCNPVFQVMFVLQNAQVGIFELPGLTLTPLNMDSGTAHFDLTLNVVDTGHKLVVTIAYNTDLFDAPSISRMLQHYKTLLENVCAATNRRLSQLQILSEPEQQQLRSEWNGNSLDQPNELNAHQLFEAQAERTPDAIAACFEDEQLTYQQLNQRANQLAHHLCALGVRAEVTVGMCLERSLDTVVGLLAILKAGGVYLPLDPEFPKERMAFMLADAKVAVLLTQQSLLARLPETTAKVVCLDSGLTSFAQEDTGNLDCPILPANLAYVIYTSGSTGQPKGVLISHAAIADHCRDIQKYYQLSSKDRVLQFASLSFDVSLEQILPTLIVGATLVLISAKMWPITDCYKNISQLGLTVLNLPTGYWQELVRNWSDLPDWKPDFQPRVFIVGGDILAADFLALWRRTPMSSIRLINAYGPTEATITATAFEIPQGDQEDRVLERIPIGRPLANREIYILNQYGNPVPVGVPGEVYIGGAGLARGYLGRPDLTAENFIPNPFGDTPGDRLYKTRDLARYRSDGNIEFLGRVDRQVKIRGFRIEPGEIETALRQHSSVRETVVTLRETVNGEKELVAYVVSQRDSTATANELRGFLKNKLPDYMMPAAFVPLDVLPLTPSGKVDRGALPEPERTSSQPGTTFVAPRNAMERHLIELWEEVLGIQRIGVTDNFFELGGHSLAAVRLFALIESRLGKKVPLAVVFEGATVEHLARILQDAWLNRRSSLVALKSSGSRPPLFLIHPAGGHVFPYIHLVNCLTPDQPCYGLQARGLEEGKEPHSRIEEMAAYYISAMRTVQAEGPYLLGGWSMGGVVAFEMAQQLYAQGQETAFLALLDTRIPTDDEEFEDDDFEVTLLVDFVRYFGLSLNPRDALARLPKHELLELLFEHAKRAGLMPSDIEVSQAQPFIELCKADFRAMRNYLLHDYPGRITVFKAGQELAGASSDPTLGWGQWAAGGVDVYVVPGNHATMVYKPHVAVLAEKLQACLDQVRAADGPSRMRSTHLSN